MKHKTRASLLLAFILSGLFAGCDLIANDSAEEKETIHGSVFPASLKGAQVKVIDVDGETIAGPVSTTSEGVFTLEVATSAYAGDFVLEATGGTFTDGATGDSLVAAGTLSAYVVAGSLNPDSAVHLTPATTILRQLKSGGKTAADADSIFEQAFGFLPSLSIKPFDATSSQGSAPEEERLAGLRAAAFSQLNHDLGLDPSRQFDLLTALARDLADKKLDGNDSSGKAILTPSDTLPEDIQNRFERALLNFWTKKNGNIALTADKIGRFPFGRVALTDKYRVEYIEGMMSAMPGRTQFKVKVSDRATGGPVTGLTIKLMPNMVMASHQHSTPIGDVTDNGDGTYGCEVYYLMAAAMSTGSMGYWELQVTAGSDTSSARFYPLVKMGMGGDVVRANLKGFSDNISNMGMAAARTYQIFNNGLTGTAGNYAFAMFISTMESMLSYPAVDLGVSLKNETGTSWTVTGMTVSASTDGSTWVEATNAGGGNWSVSGLTGLTQGTAGTIRVKLVVNGEQKTTDGLGLAGDNSNGHASFTVTPKQ